jgi:hypothetical protein
LVSMASIALSAKRSRPWNSAMSDTQLSNWLDHNPGATMTSLRRGIALIALATLGAVALTVLARKMAGALASPLEPAVLILVGATVGATAVAIRLGWLLAPTDRIGPWPNRIVMALTSMAVLLLGVGFCVPGTVGWAKLTLFILLAIEEGWAWEWYISHAGVAGTLRVPKPHTACAESNEDVIQQLTRSRAADGTEPLAGWLRMPVAAGQRTGSLHVAFCPPLASTPELEVEQIDGPEARIKTAQVLPYGARLDLKLAATAEEPTSVLVQFVARTMDCGDSSPLSILECGDSSPLSDQRR